MNTALQPRAALGYEVTLPMRAAMAIAASGLMALAAHISLPLPFTPVPLVLTPFAVLLIGMTLGPATAFGTMLLYLGEGAVGMPVFAPSGLAGLAHFRGVTAGFLFSYPLAAATAGWLVRRLAPIASPLVRGLLAGTAAVGIIFLCGAGWLATLLHQDVATAWHLAVAPFLPGEAVKIMAAALLYRSLVTFSTTPAAPGRL